MHGSGGWCAGMASVGGCPTECDARAGRSEEKVQLLRLSFPAQPRRKNPPCIGRWGFVFRALIRQDGGKLPVLVAALGVRLVKAVA